MLGPGGLIGRGRLLGLLAGALAIAAASPAAAAIDVPVASTSAKPKCFGKTATIVGTARSEKGRKKLVGTRKADVIVAKGGADDIRGGAGRDLICAGSGNDRVDGGAGKDRIEGGGGKDRLKGGAGDDEIKGGAGDDTVDGGAGTDMCTGGGGRNTLRRCEPGSSFGDSGGDQGPIDAPPVAGTDSAATTEDAPVEIAVLANDKDPEGGVLALRTLAQGTATGTLAIVDGRVVYDPTGKLDGLAAGATAVETFGYVVADAKGLLGASTVTVTITGVDDAPVAVDDAAEVDEGVPATLDVLANDTDVDGGPKKIASVDAFGASGTVAIAADGSGLTYTPGIGACGAADTFSYTLETGATAKVTVAIACSGAAPTAVDDAKTVLEDAAATAIDVLANDTDPDGGSKRVISASDPARGAVALAADGSGLTYMPDAELCGADSFTYTLNGGSTATVAVTVTCVEDLPKAVADSRTVAEDAAATAIDVLVNDTDPDGGAKTVASVTQGANGAVAITAGATGVTYKPASNHCGADSFTYTLNGGSQGTVSVTVTCVNDAPVADDEAFSGAVGNTPLAVGTTYAEPRKAIAGDVLTGDTDIDSSGLTAQAGTLATSNGGSAVMEADGQFVYHPAPGFVGTDTFSYTVTDGDKTDTGLVSVTVADRVWYVDASKPAGGTGTATAPFNTLTPLASASDPDAAGDHILLHPGTYAQPLTLEANQSLRGRSAGLTLGGATLVTPSGANPVTGVITLGTGNSIQGVDLGGLTGTSFGSATVNTQTGGLVNATGRAINLDSGTINATFTSVSSAGSATEGITLNNVSGTLTMNGGAITNANGADVAITGGTANVGYAGTITDDIGQLIRVTARTGGSVTFSGAISDGGDGDGDGVALSANAGSAIHFTGGLTLSTGAADALSATGGGTVTVTGASNSARSASGSALEVTDTTVGAAGVTFRSLSSPGGSAPGIHLRNTGTVGATTVSGAGTPASGGTIANKTGADQTVDGTGVRLDNAHNVSLNHMQLNDHQNFAIRGNSVSNFTLANSVVSGVNGTNSSIDEAAVAFSELTGVAAVTASTLSGGIEDNLQVRNTSGTLNRLTVSGSTIGHNSSAEGNDGIGLVGSGGTFNVSVTNNTFHGARGDQIQHDAGGTAVSDLVLTGNTMHSTHPNVVTGGGGVTITSSNSADLTYNASSNSIRGAKGSAIVVYKGFGGAPADATATGRIESNAIGLSGSALSGSSEGSGIALTQLARGRHTTAIRNNTIRRYSNYGILLTAGGSSTSITGVPHDGDLNATVTGNTIAEPNALAGGLSQNGIHLNSGTNSTGGADAYDVCLGLSANTVTGSGANGGADYSIRQRFETKVHLPGWTGSRVYADDAQLDAAMTSYLTSRTTGSFSAGATNNASAATGGFFNTAGSAACPTA